MANGLLLQGSVSGVSADVDTNNNLKANLPTTPAQAGIASVGTVVSDGALAGSGGPARQVRVMQSTDGGALRVAIPSPIIEAIFPGAALDTGMWSQVATTMTIAVSGGAVILNSSNSVATTVNAIIRSYRCVPIREDCETLVSFVLQTAVVPQTNTTMEWGLFYPTAHAAPTDGVLFRIDSNGLLKCVCNFNGTENTVDISALLTIAASDTYEFSIRIVGDTAYFYGSSNPTSILPLLATVQIPTAGFSTTSSFYAPLAAQIYNGGSAPALANQLKISQARAVMIGDWPARDHKIALVGGGGQGTQGQTGATLGSLANYVNSTFPASATLSNTTAGYATLGGQWQFIAVAGAETDYALFAYPVPIGTAAVPGKTFYVTGVRIDDINAVVAVGTTDTLMQWSIATGSTAVSLATVDGAGTKARRVFPLGFHSYPVGAAVGQGPQEPPLVHNFSAPLVANQGEYIHIILKMPIGTATATEIFRGIVAIEGFWE